MLLGVQVGLVQRLVVRMVQLVAVALLVVTVLVPLVKIVSDEDDDPVERQSFTGLVALITEEDARFIGDDDESVADSSHPVAIPGGLGVTRVGLVQLVTAGLAAGFATLALLTSDRRRDRVLVVLSAVVLFGAALLMAIGLRWLPVYREDEIGPAWGVWLPLLADVWVPAAHQLAKKLDV